MSAALAAGWLHVPGARRVLINEGLSTTNGGITVATGLDRITSLRRVPQGDYRILGLEATQNWQLDTGANAIDMHDVRWHSPITVKIEGWPGSAYSEVRGDALRWMVLARLGKLMGTDFALAASQTNATGRNTVMIPFAGVVGQEIWDSAPHTSLLQQISIGRLDSALPAAVVVDALTTDLYAWVAPYHKTTVPRAFSFETIAAPSDTEAKVPSADNLHLWFATDTDDAFTGTDLVTQILVGGRALLEQSTRVRDLAREFNRSIFNDGISAGAGLALSETSPEILPLIWESIGYGRALTPMKALALLGGAVANFGQDIGGTIHYHYLRSWFLSGKDEDAYLDSADIKRGVPAAVHKRVGIQPGVPVRIAKA